MALYMVIVMYMLKGCFHLFGKYAFVFQSLVWCVYEYVKTLGFLGFQYGVIGYSLWNMTLLIQIADIAGVWAVSFIVCFFSSFLGNCIVSIEKKAFYIKTWVRTLLFYCCVLFLVVFYGAFALKNEKNTDSLKIALIQTNVDPWIGGIHSYSKNLNVLMKLSNDAIRQNADLDLVVCPETAFVPHISYHYSKREDREKFVLVEKLLNYIENENVPFLIGNDECVEEFSKEGWWQKSSYNSALLFIPKENVLPPSPVTYRKMKLVPFTEYFPYRKEFSFLYNKLAVSDTHLWEKGEKNVNFQLGDFSFCVPICFEDTFGDLLRRKIKDGAEYIVNISNDAWSKSVVCQYQHLSMAAFRSVENKVPSVRSTASGQTCFIDKCGKIKSMLFPFEESYIVDTIDVEKNKKTTFYTRYGDFLPFLMIIALFFCFAFLLFRNCFFSVLRKCMQKK